MLNRSRSRYNGRNLPASFLQEMAAYGATDAWNFTDDIYLRGGVLAPSGLTVTRASNGYAETKSGQLTSFGSNVLRRTDKGALIEMARTNLALWSRDFTNAAWVKVNITAALNQTGVDGTANSASSLTATSGLGTVLQTVISPSAARVTTCYVKRLIGSGTIEFTSDGVTYTDITASLSTSAWFRVLVTGTITNPVFGFRITTSGDAIAADFAQLESATTASSPILTTTASAVRAADQVTVTLSALTSGYTMLAEWADSADGGGRIIDFGGQTLIRRSGGTVVGNGASLEGGVAVAGVSGKAAIAIDASAIRFAVDGTLSGGYSGSYSATAQTAFRFGSTGSSNFMHGYLEKVAVISSALSNANLQSVTT